ncbi:MAG: tetratricopeptide repeat protein [Deltaproteobacteria bacterium]|nr:tetratricopeptide repeat protein [Deltaproteobacteria bacterium]
MNTESVVSRQSSVVSLLLIVCCLVLWSFPVLSADREVLIDQARHLSWDKHYDESIAVYGKILKANPNDVEASIGLATVTAWNGDYTKAQKIYESLLIANPQNKEVLFGLARVLFWQGENKESLEMLDRLLAMDPTNADAIAEKQKILQEKTLQQPFKLRTYYHFEDMNFTTDANGAGFLLSYDKSKEWGVRGGFDYINKFNNSAPGYRVGGTYWATKTTVISTDIQFAPRQVVVPQQAYNVEIGQNLSKTLVASLGYRFADYRAASLHLITPSITWYLHPRLDWMAKYFFSVSQFNGREEIDNSAMTRINWNVVNPITVSAGYARDNESFDSGDPVKPGAFSANHLFGMLQWEVYKRFGIDFLFDYEKRNNGFIIKTYEAGLSYRW